MKKILIVSDSLRTGGIQVSLRSFLKFLSNEKYDITLFLFNDSLKDSLNIDNVKIISGTKILKIISYTAEEARKKGFVVFVIRKILALLCKVFSANFIYSILFMFEKRIGNYDVAISYSNNILDRSVYFGYNKYVLEKVDSRKKISYIHADYTTIHFKISDREYKKFDSIWCVSNFVKQTFLKYNPDCEKKCKVVYNFIDEDKIKKIDKNPFNSKKFHIVTVGRLDQNKSQINSINICKKLIEKGVNFDWYLLGEGPEMIKIKDAIEQNDLSKYIYILGNKDNVSDYLNFCDFFVSLSKSESYGLAIAESLLLNKITIVKDMPVASEIIQNNGIICKTDDEIVEELYNLMVDSVYYKNIQKKSKLIFDNQKNLENVKNILNM